MILHDDLTDIAGLRVGHDTNVEAGTGCTVVLCDLPARAGVDVRGGAPATRETDLLRPVHLIEEVHAIVLTGGSAYGLDAASGVMRYLEERHIGLDVGVARVPIVPAAALFDLPFGSATIRPDAAAGYRACEQATAEAVAQGNVGAGTGATVGKQHHFRFAMKGGIGSASTQLPDGTLVGAIAAVNAWGNIVEHETRQVIAGSRAPEDEEMDVSHPFQNTTLAVVATDAYLTKEQVNKVAQMAHNGLALTIEPAHTMFDGETVFALALGPKPQAPLPAAQAAYRVSMIGAAAASTLARAVVKGIRQARDLHGIPATHQEGSGGSRIWDVMP